MTKIAVSSGDPAGIGPDIVSIDDCKKLIRAVEKYYTDCGKQFSREWADEPVRLAWHEAVNEVDTCEDLAVLLTKLDDGMSIPNFTLA